MKSKKNKRGLDKRRMSQSKVLMYLLLKICLEWVTVTEHKDNEDN